MKKLLLILLMASLMPFSLVAQNVNDDLYYTPSKKQEAKVDIQAPVKTTTVVVQTDTPMKVVVRDKKKQVRDIDEYNRRYESSDYEFSADNDTLYIDEREVSELEGEWVNGFDGTEEDYEYAVRLIRFRNPRYAISISSPFYWDVVYGMNSWDWNVYTDGYYAYAFPTYTNRLWYNWRFGPSWYNSYWGWGWNSYWDYPYYSWHHHYHHLDWYYHHHHHYFPPHYVGGRHFTHNAYTNRASRVYRANASTRPSSDRLMSSRSTSRRATSVANGRQTVRANSDGSARQVSRGSSTSTRRVVGTRSSSTISREQGTNVRSESTNSTRNRTTVTRSGSNRSDAASSRRSTYTRPSSTRTTEATSGGSSSRSSSTYSRSSSRSSNNDRSTINSSSSRSYNSSGSSSRSSSGSFSSGGSSRSSGGGFSSGGGGGSRSGGGGSSRSGRR